MCCAACSARARSLRRRSCRARRRLGAQQHRPVRVRARADDDRLVAGRDHDERADELVLRVAAGLHLGLGLAARAEVEAEQVGRCPRAGVVAHLEHAADEQLHERLARPLRRRCRGRARRPRRRRVAERIALVGRAALLGRVLVALHLLGLLGLLVGHGASFAGIGRRAVCPAGRACKRGSSLPRGDQRSSGCRGARQRAASRVPQ